MRAKTRHPVVSGSLQLHPLNKTVWKILSLLQSVGLPQCPAATEVTETRTFPAEAAEEQKLGNIPIWGPPRASQLR